MVYVLNLQRVLKEILLKHISALNVNLLTWIGPSRTCPLQKGKHVSLGHKKRNVVFVGAMEAIFFVIVEKLHTSEVFKPKYIFFLNVFLTFGYFFRR